MAMIVDMLLWATDHAPGEADMVVISRVLDHSIADAIHQLRHSNFGFKNLDEFLQASVPGIDFKSFHMGSRPWIFCNGPGMDNGARQSMLISKANSTPPVHQVLSYGPLTMEEVRNWLQELVTSGRANAGVNLSLLGKDFEDSTGKKLNHKSLHCPNLMTLLSKFENLVRLERKESMVIMLPRDCRSATPTVTAHAPVNRMFERPRKYEAPARPPFSSLPSVVQAPGLINTTRNVPTPMPVPRFSSVLPNITTVRTSTEAFVNVPSPTAPFAPKVGIAPATGGQASEGNGLNHLPNPHVVGLTGDVAEKNTESLLPAMKKRPAPTVTDILAAHRLDPISVSSTTPFKLPPDLVRDAKTASVMKVKQAGDKQPLPNADYTAVPTPVVEKGNPARNGADAGIFSDAGNAKKFDYYHLTSTVEEREAIKRTFESVNRRLREEFKKRRLAQVSPVDACDRTNNTP